MPNYLFLKPGRAEISEDVEILLRAVVNKVDGPLNQAEPETDKKNQDKHGYD